jgi:hypothetical protein
VQKAPADLPGWSVRKALKDQEGLPDYPGRKAPTVLQAPKGRWGQQVPKGQQVLRVPTAPKDRRAKQARQARKALAD